MAIKTISPQDLYKHMKLGHSVVLLDVRPQEEYEEAHIIGAKSYPLESFNAKEIIHKVCVPYPTPPTLYVTCASGSESLKACQRLAEAGYEYITRLEGGMYAWAVAGLPLKGANPNIPHLTHPKIHQQIQVAIGSLIAIGTLLGTLVNVGFLLIPFLAGVGFMYEGLFGTGDLKQAFRKAFGNP